MPEYEFVMSPEEAEAFGHGERNRAKVPVRSLPPRPTMAETGYTTKDYRDAMSGEGPLAYQWKDKPHRLIYDLCYEVEHLRKQLEKRATEKLSPAFDEHRTF